ncbi:MAG: hypothetical protein DHS20C18_34810 [Saprospiraceae bacterium]|nr:MAG: hypothetical protein DHS20C18_34810 [Saprospiraceae bacterium]
MKTADHVTTSRNLQQQKAQSPFAKKDGEQSFFSEVQPEIQPFFNPQLQAQSDFFFSQSTIQAKLTIGQPGDKYEQEADAVADKVVDNIAEPAVSNGQSPESFTSNEHSQAAAVQTQPAVQTEKEEVPEEKDQEGTEKEVQRKPIFESEDNTDQGAVQPKLSNEAPVIQHKEEEESTVEEDQEGQTQKEIVGAGDELPEEPASEKESIEMDPTIEASETKSELSPASEETAVEEGSSVNMPEESTTSVEQAETSPQNKTALSDGPAEKGEEKAPPQSSAEETATEAVAGSSEPSETKMEKSLSEGGGKPTAKSEVQRSAGAGGSGNENASVESGGPDSSGKGQTTEVAEAAAIGDAGATKNQGTQEENAGGTINEIPAGKDSVAFPEPDEKLPGKEPPPLDLGISKGQQRDLILSKGATEEPSSELSDKLQQSKGQGQSLDETTSQQMGQQMGANFGDVKIHIGDEATSMNQEIGAKAFTHGKDIYFNQGQYDTSSKEGKRLLAHELTHTVQQGAVSSVSPKLEKTDTPKLTKSGSALQRYGGLAGSLIGAAGQAAKAVAIEALKASIRSLGKKAMSKLMEEVTGMKGDQQSKDGDWKSQLMNMGKAFLSSENMKDQVIEQAKGQAEELMAVKKGEESVEKGKADPLPAGISALIQKVMGFATGSGGGAKGRLMGTDQAAEQEAVHAGVQEDAAGWENINALTNELAPMAGEKEEEVKNLVSAMGKLKESSWKSLPSWQELFQAGKGLIPGLGGMMETGKQALTDGLSKLKGKLGENATQLWEVGSKLANGILSGSGSFKERALKVAKDFGMQMLGGVREEGTKVVGEAQGLEGRGGQLANALMSLVDGRAAKAFETVSSAISQAGSLISMAPGRVGQAARSALNWVKSKLGQGKGRLRQIINKIKQFVVKVKNAIVKMLKRAWEFLKKAVKKAIEAGKRLLKWAWAKIKALAKKAMAMAKKLLKSLMDKIKAFLKPALDWLKKKVIAPIKGMIKRAKERIKAWVKRMKEKWRKRFGKDKKDGKEKGNLGAALQEIERRGRSELDEGEVTRNEADKIKSKVNRAHSNVINITSIKDGGETWDFEYVQKVEETKIPKTSSGKPPFPAPSDVEGIRREVAKIKEEPQFKGKIFKMKELKNYLVANYDIKLPTTVSRTEKMKSLGILFTRESEVAGTADVNKDASFDQNLLGSGARPVTPNHSNRKKFGYINVQKGTSTGILIMKKGLLREEQYGYSPEKEDDLDYLQTEARFLDSKHNEVITWDQADLGHGEVAAVDHWNQGGGQGDFTEAGHKQTFDANKSWNQNPDNFHGPEEYHKNRADNRGVYLTPGPPNHPESNSMWWDPNDANYIGN